MRIIILFISALVLFESTFSLLVSLRHLGTRALRALRYLGTRTLETLYLADVFRLRREVRVYSSALTDFRLLEVKLNLKLSFETQSFKPKIQKR